MRNSKLAAKGAPAVRERRKTTGRDGPHFEVVDGAEEGTRTPTAFRPPAPKAGASANSATSALRNSITRDRQALAADVSRLTLLPRNEIKSFRHCVSSLARGNSPAKGAGIEFPSRRWSFLLQPLAPKVAAAERRFRSIARRVADPIRPQRRTRTIYMEVAAAFTEFLSRFEDRQSGLTK